MLADLLDLLGSLFSYMIWYVLLQSQLTLKIFTSEAREKEQDEDKGGGISSPADNEETDRNRNVWSFKHSIFSKEFIQLPTSLNRHWYHPIISVSMD